MALYIQEQSKQYDFSVYNEAKKLCPNGFDAASPKITKVDIEPIAKLGIPCFKLLNVLSVDECKALIKSSEAKGYEDAGTYLLIKNNMLLDKYCHMYRDRYNDRLMSDDAGFSKLIFSRVSEFLPKEILGSKMFSKQMQLESLNERWRYCKYSEGHYFGAHVDGVYRPPYESGVFRSSYLTFLLYLNGPQKVDDEIPVFQGGSTNFLTPKQQLIYECVPEAGSALVFVQEDIKCFHDGGKLLGGTKYILRTDVMYKRTA